MPTVTALRLQTRDRVRVELDGELWRVVPAEVVVRSGFAVGRELDRPALRQFRRELRRSQALAAAGRALRHRDLSQRRLEERLERAAVAPAIRTEALEALSRAGLLDDERAARSRAEALATRGYGDAAIRHDLERQGIDSELGRRSVDALTPEAERARAVIARRGGGLCGARALARKGFGEEAIETALGVEIADDT